MNLFGRKKDRPDDKSHIYWRDARGKVACSRSTCSPQCESGCPIHYSTIGLEFFQLGDAERAISYLQQSVKIAPDFDEAWNNLGACYGSISKYSDSLNAYQKAHELAPNKPRPLYGMALAHRDLGKLKESLQCCDKYDAIVKDGALNKVRNEALKRLKNINAPQRQEGSSADAVQATSILKDLISYGHKEGYLTNSDHFNFIPEITMNASEVVHKLWTNLWKSFDEDGDNDMGMRLSITLRFCACAGIGAVMHWHLDWPALSRNGIYETLTAPRELFAMDEYVTDLVGIHWGTPESDRLVTHLNNLLGVTMKYFALANDNPQKGAMQYMECFKAAYLYGMALQMSRLGMK